MLTRRLRVIDEYAAFRLAAAGERGVTEPQRQYEVKQIAEKRR